MQSKRNESREPPTLWKIETEWLNEGGNKLRRRIKPQSDRWERHEQFIRAAYLMLFHEATYMTSTMRSTPYIPRVFCLPRFYEGITNEMKKAYSGRRNELCECPRPIVYELRTFQDSLDLLQNMKTKIFVSLEEIKLEAMQWR